MSSRPRIGISVCLDRGKRWRPGHDYYYVSRAYARRVSEAGGIPLLLSPDCDATDALGATDALVITGGGDLPRRRDELDAFSGAGTLGEAEDLERIRWERRLIDAYAEAARPLLGICYGMQLLNLHFGGSLLRDLRSEHPGALDHGGSGRVTHHGLERGDPSALLSGWFAATSAQTAAAEPSSTGPTPRGLSINSSHGQAIAELAPGFRVTARATDGIVEAIEQGTLFGVEWHPETDEHGHSVFVAFLAQITGKTSG